MKHKRNLYPPILLALALTLIGFAAYNLRKMPASPYPEIRPSFTLQSATGPVSIRDIRGKVSVVYFGYTHCPDVCPATLSNIGAALRLLTPKEREKVRALFVTTDPARDTPASMARFVKHFDADIIGLSGSEAAIAAAAKSFMAGYGKDKKNHGGKNYAVVHSSFIYILRPDGKIGRLLSHTSTPKQIAAAIRKWTPWAG